MTNAGPLFPSITDWQGRWIWAPPGTHGTGADGRRGIHPTNVRVLFRTEVPRSSHAPARLRITADSHYRVWINGRRIGDGPPPSHPVMQLVDEYDLSATVGSFGAGPLCILVLVHHLGIDSHRRGGLLAELELADGSVPTPTGGDWRCRVVSGSGLPWASHTQFERMNQVHPFQEHLDQRLLRPDWFRPGCDLSGWDRACILETRGVTAPGTVMPWARLVPRGIPLLDEHVTLAERVEAEECLDLANRTHAEDLSISLSQVGRPVEWARVENLDAVTSPDPLGTTPSPIEAVESAGRLACACSTRHHTLEVDGRYDPCLTLDFGHVLTGRIELNVADAPAGSVVEIGYAERLVDGRFNNAIECRFADKVTLAAGAGTFLPLAWRSFRYVRIRIKYAEAPIVFDAIRARRLSYPYEERGRFSSRRADLESIERICRNTIKLCSVESLMDTPHREQAQWLGDVSLVTVPGIIACFGDTAIAGKFFRQATINALPTGILGNLSNVPITDYQGAIPSFSLWWVISVERFHTYSGDDRFLHYCYPELLRIMRAHLEQIDSDGFVATMPGWPFVDWASVDIGAKSSVYNAIFVGAADAAAKLARRRGDTWAEEMFDGAAATVRSAFPAVFFDEKRGVVLDGPATARAAGGPTNEPVAGNAAAPSTATETTEEAVAGSVAAPGNTGGAASDPPSAVIPPDATSSVARLVTGVSEHATGAALAFACLDSDRASRAVDAVFAERTVAAVEAQPFFMAVILEGLAKHGRRDLALDLLSRRWGRMIERGWESCGEEWYINGSWRNGYWYGFERTLSHAWSAYAAEFLIRVLPGIEVLEPGCGRLRVDPFRADFPYRSVYPVPQGEVTVEWDGTEARVTSPAAVTVE